MAAGVKHRRPTAKQADSVGGVVLLLRNCHSATAGWKSCRFGATAELATLVRAGCTGEKMPIPTIAAAADISVTALVVRTSEKKRFPIKQRGVFIFFRGADVIWFGLKQTLYPRITNYLCVGRGLIFASGIILHKRLVTQLRCN